MRAARYPEPVSIDSGGQVSKDCPNMDDFFLGDAIAAF
ncbi:hypothetical protein ACVIWV_005098 [Bradyrhizobium diazoefficiens]|nr:hypothetical protein [Bradyrhizobium japonicum]